MKDEIEKMINHISNDYRLEEEKNKNKKYYKKDNNYTIRIILRSSSWDIDLWEGEKYTIKKPYHKIYLGGIYFDYFKICLKEVEDLLNEIKITYRAL